MQSEFEVYTDIVPLYLSSPLTDTEREAILFCVSCAQDYRDTLDGSEERATQMIETAMRFAMPPVGPAPVEGPRTASVTDVGGAGPTLADEEREAIEMAIRRERGEWYGNPDYMRAITLRGLLERTRNG
jgi:hypothetical protein